MRWYGDEIRCLFPTADCLFCPSSSGRNVKHTNTAHSDSLALCTKRSSGKRKQVEQLRLTSEVIPVSSSQQSQGSLSRHTWRLAASCSQGPARRSQHHREQNISSVSHSTRTPLTPPTLENWSLHTTNSVALYQGSKSTRNFLQDFYNFRRK